MKEDKRNSGFPDLDKYLKERGRKLVNYEEGAEIYGIPYYLYSLGLHTFEKLAKDANAIYRVKGRVLINIEIIDEYMHDVFESSGYFILISSLAFDADEILEVYYLRQQVEQYFDISKGISRLTPLRVHTEHSLFSQIR